MKTNLPQLLLTVGLSVGIISIPSIAKAGIRLNGSSLTGQVSRPTSQDQPQRFTKGLGFNGSSLKGQVSRPTSQERPQLKTKILGFNGSSLTGQKIKKQQQSKALTIQGSSLTGQSSQKQKSTPVHYINDKNNHLKQKAKITRKFQLISNKKLC